MRGMAVIMERPSVLVVRQVAELQSSRSHTLGFRRESAYRGKANLVAGG